MNPCPLGYNSRAPQEEEFASVSDVTQILSAIEQGDPRAAGQLLPLVYDELRKLAAQKMREEKPGQTLQATALVHEAYIRLVDVERAQHWDSRGHFFAAAAEAMRRILVDNARRKLRIKRGGEQRRLDLDDADLVTNLPPDELLLLHDAIETLAAHDHSAAELVKLRYFVGLSVEDAAETLGIPRASAYRHWTYARAWLISRVQRSQ
jgi:RNA polymerase sigma factor (TIGR02999 family)